MQFNRILCVFGTRPEAIKIAPLLLEMNKLNPKPNVKVCVTAQHREMLDMVINIFDIKVDYDLDLMKKGQSLHNLTTDVIIGIKEVLYEFKPDLVVVHGDTTTAFSTSLACFYEKIPVAHIEAGLRTNNIYSPWPEELNRQLISRIATFHFAPTENNKESLIEENINPKNIYVTGNTVIDSLFMVMEKIENNSSFKNKLEFDLKRHGIDLVKYKRLILVTLHRRENFGKRLINICNSLKKIASDNPDLCIIYPVHLNPNVQIPVHKILKNIKNIYLTEPLDYTTFIYLMSKSYFILTDSGGIQEEAASFNKPVLIIRDTTERKEAIHAGTAKLIGTEERIIISEVQKFINNENECLQMSNAVNPFGDGRASERIVNSLF